MESINFFKDPIEPKWEFGDNAKGGYFSFSFNKETPNKMINDIYESLVFMALGSTFQLCDHLKGVRIIDTAIKKSFRCRFEIWVDYP